MTDDALVLQDVCKRFGDVVAVEDLSLRVPRGSIYGFLGPNGAGKTTTLRMIMSIFYPDAGTIRVLGHPNAETVKDRLGYLPEERGLYDKMTVGDVASYFGRLKGMDARQAKERAVTLLTRFGLGDWLDKPNEALSKGMRQKVQLVVTMIHNPELMILDEPFSGLDPVNVELMRDLILRMKRDGKTVIFSTHVMEQAEQLCDYILLINKGRKVLDGSLAEVKRGGGHSVQLDYDGDGTVLQQLPGIRRINDAGKTAELVLADGTDPQNVLSQLVGQLTIRRFDVSEVSLHEIFVQAVRGNVSE